MTTQRMKLLAGVALSGTLLLGTTGLAMAQEDQADLTCPAQSTKGQGETVQGGMGGQGMMDVTEPEPAQAQLCDVASMQQMLDHMQQMLDHMQAMHGPQQGEGMMGEGMMGEGMMGEGMMGEGMMGEGMMGGGSAVAGPETSGATGVSSEDHQRHHPGG